jgi:NAD-dependent dihydropyrimidine dehydrogenase PreA subunit
MGTGTRTYLGIPREQIPWAPRIDAEACIGCSECLNFCPNGVYVLNETEGKVEVANPQSCVVLCDKCGPTCPNDAISFPDREQTKRLLKDLGAKLRAK